MEDGEQNGKEYEHQSQGIEEILSIIQEARQEGPKVRGQMIGGMSMDLDDLDADDDDDSDFDDIETSGDFVCAM